MVFTFYSLVVLQADIRAFYKKLSGKVTQSENNWSLLFGIITTISLPCIGYFDMHTYGFFHYTFAILFFGFCFAYIFYTVGLLVKHKDEFPQDEQRGIRKSNRFRWFILFSALFYGYTKLFYDTHSDFYEWLIVLFYLNAMAIINLTNKFYDTVYEELTPRQPVVVTKTVFA